MNPPRLNGNFSRVTKALPYGSTVSERLTRLEVFIVLLLLRDYPEATAWLLRLAGI